MLLALAALSRGLTRGVPPSSLQGDHHGLDSSELIELSNVRAEVSEVLEHLSDARIGTRSWRELRTH